MTEFRSRSLTRHGRGRNNSIETDCERGRSASPVFDHGRGREEGRSISPPRNIIKDVYQGTSQQQEIEQYDGAVTEYGKEVKDSNNYIEYNTSKHINECIEEYSNEIEQNRSELTSKDEELHQLDKNLADQQLKLSGNKLAAEMYCSKLSIYCEYLAKIKIELGEKPECIDEWNKELEEKLGIELIKIDAKGTSSLQANLQAKKQQLINLKMEMSREYKQLNKNNSKLNDMESNCLLYKNELQKSRKQLENLSQQLASESSQLPEWKKELSDKEVEHANIESEIRQKKEKSGQLKKEIDKKQQLLNSSKTRKTEILGINDHLEKDKNSLKKLKEEISEKRQKYENLSNLAELKERKATLQQELQKPSEKDSEKDSDLQTKYEDLKKLNDSLKQLMEDNEKSLDEKLDGFIKFTESANKKDSSFEKLHKDAKNLKNRLKALYQSKSEEINSLSSMRDSLEEVSSYFTDEEKEKVEKQIQEHMEYAGLSQEDIDQYTKVKNGSKEQYTLNKSALFIEGDKKYDSLDKVSKEHNSESMSSHKKAGEAHKNLCENRRAIEQSRIVRGIAWFFNKGVEKYVRDQALEYVYHVRNSMRYYENYLSIERVQYQYCEIILENGINKLTSRAGEKIKSKLENIEEKKKENNIVSKKESEIDLQILEIDNKIGTMPIEDKEKDLEDLKKSMQSLQSILITDNKKKENLEKRTNRSKISDKELEKYINLERKYTTEIENDEKVKNSIISEINERKKQLKVIASEKTKLEGQIGNIQNQEKEKETLANQIVRDEAVLQNQEKEKETLANQIVGDKEVLKNQKKKRTELEKQISRTEKAFKRQREVLEERINKAAADLEGQENERKPLEERIREIEENIQKCEKERKDLEYNISRNQRLIQEISSYL